MLRPDGEGAPNYGPEAQATPPPLGVNFFSTHLRHYGGFPLSYLLLIRLPNVLRTVSPLEYKEYVV